MPRTKLRAARANRVFCTHEQHIRAEHTVMVNPEQGVGVLYEITDRARTAFRPRAIGDPRGRVAVRASVNAAVRPMLLHPRQIEPLKDSVALGRHA